MTDIVGLINPPIYGSVNSDYAFWAPEWMKIRDCLMGETVIKRRTTVYLPKLDGQTDEEYKAYLKRAVFFNATARTVSGLLGQIYRREPVVDGLPEGETLDDVSKEGLSLCLFSKKIAQEVLSIGRFGVLLDMASDGSGDPYFVGYGAETILDWSTAERGGRIVLERVVLREFLRVTGEAGDSEVEEITRVLLLDENGIYRQRVYFEAIDTALNTSSVTYTETTPKKFGQPFTYIPFLIFGPTQLGFDVEKPPMLDIVSLNLSHYQSYAALEHGRFFTATPVFYASTSEQDPPDYYVGPGVVWSIGPNDKAGIIEYHGHGLKFLENACTTKELQIASLGGRLVGGQRGIAAESSESVELRERSEQTLLQNVVHVLNDGVTKMLRWWLDWKGTPAAEAKITFSNDLTPDRITARELRAMESLWKSGIISVEILYAAFKDAEILPADMTLEQYRNSLPAIAPATSDQLRVTALREFVRGESTPRKPEMIDHGAGLSPDDISKLKELLAKSV